MKEPSIPPDEPERLAVLHAHEILDTAPEDRFDRVTRTASRTFGVPIALVSLVDTDRQWFKSCVGLAATETPRSISFCGHAILEPRTFVIEDAAADPRFADNPLVTGAPFIRFYAGHPVRGRDGYRLGTLCVIDRVPRRFTDSDRAALADLAGWVETELAFVTTQEAAEVIRRFERFFALSGDLFCVADFRGMFRRVSPSWTRTLGWTAAELYSRPYVELVHPDDVASTAAEAAKIAAGAETLRFSNRYRHRDGSYRTLEWMAVPLVAEDAIYAVARDVTDERAAAAALATSEARYRDLFDNANDLIQAVDGEGRFLYVNRAWRETLGYDEEEIRRSTLLDVVAPASRDHCQVLFQRLAQGEDVGTVEAEFLARDGRTVVLEGRVSARRESAEMVSTRAIFRDVTERRRVARDLDASMQMLRAVSEAQRDFIGANDARRSFDRLLESLLHLTGSEYGFIGEVGAGVDDAGRLRTHAVRGVAGNDEVRALGEAAQSAGSLLETAIRTGEPVITNEPAPDARASGAPPGHPPLRAFLGLPFHAHGRAVGMVGLANRPGGYDQALVDYLAPFLSTCASLVEALRREASRAELELAVRESEVRLRAIVESSVDGLVTIDELGRVESFNPAAERLFQRSAADVVGRSVSTLMPPPHRERLDSYLEAYRRTGEKTIVGSSRDVAGLRADGTTFPMDLAVTEVRLAERQIFTMRVHDLTERKRIERMKEEFVSTVSHELRTPLTSIRGSLGLLAGGVAGEVSPRARAMVDIALRSSERLVRLINDILDVEKIEFGRMDFAARVCDVGALVAQSVEAHRGFAAPLGVELEIVDEASPALAMLDPDRMLQVLANLISNAAKFSPRGATVTVRLTRDREQLAIEVIDRGPGIPEAFQKRVFERFAQADSSDSRQRGGTGLGLSITRAIVQQLGGEISFRTEPDRGTTFTVRLPERQPGRALAAIPAPRVLVCEDDRDVAQLLVMMLEQAGVSADVAESAAAARALLLAGRYDAMTLDMVLPDADGLGLLRELRQAGHALPVIVVSARSRAVGEIEGAVLGVFDWITKPIEPRRLVEAVRGSLRGGDGSPAVLHVEDDDGNRRVVADLLHGIATVRSAPTLAEARACLAQPFDLVLLDVTLPDGDGLTLLPEIAARAIPVIVFSAADVPADASRRVDATLVKSRASNDDLRDAILRALGAARAPS